MSLQRYTENPAANWINFHGKTGTNRNQRCALDGRRRGTSTTSSVDIGLTMGSNDMGAWPEHHASPKDPVEALGHFESAEILYFIEARTAQQRVQLGRLEKAEEGLATFRGTLGRRHNEDAAFNRIVLERLCIDKDD